MSAVTHVLTSQVLGPVASWVPYTFGVCIVMTSVCLEPWSLAMPCRRLGFQLAAGGLFGDHDWHGLYAPGA